jgi:hypothetical protein
VQLFKISHLRNPCTSLMQKVSRTRAGFKRTDAVSTPAATILRRADAIFSAPKPF